MSAPRKQENRSTSSQLHICRSTSSHLHICRSTSSHLHICRSIASHLHICRSTSSHHICRCTSCYFHICGSSLSLSLCVSLALLSFSRPKKIPFPSKKGSNEKIIPFKSLKHVSTTFHEERIARHVADEEETKGFLAPIAARVLIKVLFAARMARFDLLRAVQGLAARVTKWN